MSPPDPLPAAARRQPRPLRFWLALLVASTLLLLAVLLAATGLLAESHFDRLEREAAEAEAHLAARALDRLAAAKRAAATEYGTWDDMLAFVRAPQRPGAAEWAAINVTDWHRQQYADEAVQIWNAARQPVLEWSTPHYAGVAEELADGALFALLERERRLGGFVRTSRGLAVLGAAVITRSEDLDASEAAGGYLLALRPLDRSHLAELHDVLGKAVAIELPGRGSAPLEAPGYTARGDRLEIELPLHDIHGRPIARVLLSEPRDLLLAIRASLRTTTGIAAGLGVFLLGLLWLATQRLVVRPLAELEAVLERMRRSGRREPIGVAPPSHEWALFIERFNETVQALQSSEARYRVLFDQAADAIFLIERDSGRVLAANPAAETLTGLPRAALLGAVLPEQLVPEGGEIRFCGTFRAIRADRSRRTIAASCTELDLDGVPCILISMRDQTEREQLAEAIRETQKLEGLAVLAGGVAHDFNNLLAVIAGNAGMAQREQDPERRARKLANIEKASARASDLTRQLLAYAGSGQLLRTGVDLGELTREMAELLRTTIGQQARLELDLAPDLPPIEADPGQLQQVVLNLITNAAEALEDRPGTIGVHCAPVELETAQALELGVSPGRYVALEVCDSGSGMTPEVQRRVFEPFFTTKFTGRGLGLAAVYGIARGHRGHVGIVASAPGLGTTIRVLLPAATAVASAPAAVAL